MFQKQVLTVLEYWKNDNYPFSLPCSSMLFFNQNMSDTVVRFGPYIDFLSLYFMVDRFCSLLGSFVSFNYDRVRTNDNYAIRWWLIFHALTKVTWSDPEFTSVMIDWPRLASYLCTQ